MPRVFAVIHKDQKVRIASRSGGGFTALSDLILSQGGAVFGCAMEDCFHAVHIPAYDKNVRDTFRTSKYIESDLAKHECFKIVRQLLLKGQWVLFSGTSCQISGLLSYLRDISCPTLLTIDILCHGIPSSRIWRDYLSWFTKKKNGNAVENVIFRNKGKFGWADHTETITISGKQYHNKYFRDLYSTNYISRPACYSCPYKKLEHEADITLGDYWGLNRVYPDFGADNKGISLVLVNSDKGWRFFEQILEFVQYKETDIEHCLQGALISPYKCPIGRDEFWNAFYNKGFSFIIKKYTNNILLSKFKQLIPSSIRKHIRGK